MKSYKTIFFDLDHTLWDFETNSTEALVEIADKYDFKAIGIPSIELFLQTYFHINEKMWEDYRKGLIDMPTLRYGRFQKALSHFNIFDKALSQSIANDYISTAPYKTNLFPHTKEVLTYLSGKYPIHIITNGFQDVQLVKIKNCGIEHFFTHVITSEKTGFKKPDIRVFEHALITADTTAAESIMIGDCLDADIGGARNAGIDQVYFNPKGYKHAEKMTHEINSLKELITIL